MSDFPLGVRITLFGGIFAMLGLIWTQSQRLGDVRSTFLSRILGVLGFLGSVAWIEFGLWLFWKIDLLGSYPWTFWTIAIMSCTAIAAWAIENGWFIATKSGEGEQGVIMLFAKMWQDFPDREDQRGEYALEVCLRSDYPKPIGAEFVQWVETGARTGGKLPITNFVKLRGLRHPKGNPPYTTEDQRGYGPTKMVVNPAEAFRVTVDVHHVSARPIDSVPDDHPIGILVLRVEGQELQFPVVYREVKKQSLSRYETWRRSQQ